ncbi:MAG TPA: GNAT family N-acetyltransferase [Herpetosiphonaceae bacterium]
MRASAFHSLETPRLHIRHFTPADLPTLLAYRNDPLVARYQSWESMTEAEGRAFIAEMQQHQPGEPGPGFQFAIALKTSGLHIGDCYFKVLDYDPRQAEIGYSLAREHWGQGLATEALNAILEYSFRTLDLHRIIAITDCENRSSIALLERLGMRREGHFLKSMWSKGAWSDEYQYALLGEEWRSRHDSAPQ